MRQTALAPSYEPHKQMQQVCFSNWPARRERGSMPGMNIGYNQFCPVAKASEILATRWTPLILRELMGDVHSFNDIVRGIPLISRAVLVARLRELQEQGIIERRHRADGSGPEYWLTPAGSAFGPVIVELRRWGLANARDRVKSDDLDPSLLLWRFPQASGSRRASGSTRRRPLRVRSCAGKPHQVSHHVACP